ncbi:MAG: hypothetical protein ACRDL0_05345, partial [Thermoleophilaceae bacterium]
IAAALRAEGHDTGRIEGATQERARIQAVRAQCMPGHEALIETLAYDGKTTGPEAAVQVLAAENHKRAQRLDDLRAEAPAPLPPSLEEAPGTVNPNQVAAAARVLVAEAKNRGEVLSYAAAVLRLKRGGAYA